MEKVGYLRKQKFTVNLNFFKRRLQIKSRRILKLGILKKIHKKSELNKGSIKRDHECWGACYSKLFRELQNNHSNFARLL